jgi:NAD(P)-dependent dehydrogenase (short-subunit alcohol dehydrogenase family)
VIEWQTIEDIETRTGAELAARFTPRKGWQVVCAARLADADRMVIAAHRQPVIKMLSLRQLARQYRFDAPGACAEYNVDPETLRQYMAGLRKGENRKAFEAGWPEGECDKTQKGRP